MPAASEPLAERRGVRRPGRRQDRVAPCGRFGDVVARNLDVARNQSGRRRHPAAEHDILSGPLDVIVDDAIGAGPVPARDGLRVGIRGLDVGDITVEHIRRATVQRDPALLPFRRMPVDVHAIEDDVMRWARVCLVRADRDQRFVPKLRGTVEIDELQPIVMGARCGPQ